MTDALTVYAGYSNIFQSQASYLDGDHNPIDPIIGSNVETGLKWATHDGRLNLSLAAYRIEQNGFQQIDFNYPIYQEISPGIYCCFVGDPNQTYKSEGLDIEATGEVLPGLQLAASYTYSETKQKGSTFGSDEGLPFVSIQPKQLYKLWMSYDFGSSGSSGLLSGLTLSGGINGQSSAFYSGRVCVNLNPPDPVSGASSCVSNGPPNRVPFEFTVPAYALLSARIDYAFSPIWSLAVNLENILDKTYYQTAGQSPGYGNWYGAPRSFTATLRAKW